MLAPSMLCCGRLMLPRQFKALVSQVFTTLISLVRLSANAPSMLCRILMPSTLMMMVIMMVKRLYRHDGDNDNDGDDVGGGCGDGNDDGNDGDDCHDDGNDKQFHLV